MADPLTLTGVGVVALAEGIKFLYEQAGDALRRWREQKSRGGDATVEPVDVELPGEAFVGKLEAPQVHFAAVEPLQQELRDLRAAVADYAQGIDEVDTSDEELLQAVEGLRQAMEVIYGQRITFRGEPRSSSGSAVVGEASVDEVFGYVAGLRARRIIGSSAVTGQITARRIHPGAEAVGLDVGTIGSDLPEPPGQAGDAGD